MLAEMKFWFLGFRAGWWEMRNVPLAALLTPDPLNRAYYNGYISGANLHRSFIGGNRW